MSNTDGEDIQRIEDDVDGFSFSKGYVSGFEAGEKQLKETRKVVASQNKELASLREQLATEQDMRSTAEFANRMIIKDLNEKLKQKEDENRELKNKTIELCIAHLVSHFPKFGNKEFSVRGIREILDALKNLSA